MANQGASNNQPRPARDRLASGGKILTGARCCLSEMPLKRFTAHQALTQILADDSEDIDASDYGNDSDFESEVRADSCHDSNISGSESDAAKPTATQPHGDTRPSSRGQVHGRYHGTGRGAQRGRGDATNVGPGANRDNVDSYNSTLVIVTMGCSFHHKHCHRPAGTMASVQKLYSMPQPIDKKYTIQDGKIY